MREAQGYTQQSLSAATGISPSAISNYEVGRFGLSRDRLQKIADVLKVSVAELAPAQVTPTVPLADAARSKLRGRIRQQNLVAYTTLLGQLLEFMGDREVIRFYKRAVAKGPTGLVSLFVTELERRGLDPYPSKPGEEPDL